MQSSQLPLSTSLLMPSTEPLEAKYALFGPDFISALVGGGRN